MQKTPTTWWYTTIFTEKRDNECNFWKVCERIKRYHNLLFVKAIRYDSYEDNIKLAIDEIQTINLARIQTLDFIVSGKVENYSFNVELSALDFNFS